MKNPHLKSVYQNIHQLILQNNSFFIAGHRRPDGDSVAAQLVLADMLKRLNKKGEIYSADPIPKNLMFLPGIDTIKICRQVSKRYDVAFIVECSGQSRMGDIIDLKRQASHVINIDHHAHFNSFGDINLVNPDASSSCEQIHGLLNDMNIEITGDNAVCLYIGILTDTGGFRHANTSSLAHQLAAQYISMGVSPDKMYNNIYQQKTINDLHFWGRTLSDMKTYLNGRAVVIEIPPSNADTEDIIGFGMMIPDVFATVLLQPQARGRVRVSMRSRGFIDVGKIAVSFGGGGHMRAAGCSLRGTVKQVRSKILMMLQKYFSQ